MFKCSTQAGGHAVCLVDPLDKPVHFAIPLRLNVSDMILISVLHQYPLKVKCFQDILFILSTMKIMELL